MILLKRIWVFLIKILHEVKFLILITYLLEFHIERLREVSDQMETGKVHIFTISLQELCDSEHYTLDYMRKENKLLSW